MPTTLAAPPPPPAAPVAPPAPEEEVMAGYVTPEAYLRRERARREGPGDEWLDGTILPASVASLHHSVVIANVATALNTRLRETDCLVASQSLRVRVTGGGLYAYPDIVVVQGEPAVADAHRDMITNPALLVEVLSPSTRDFDQGDKFARYRRLPSLQAYVMIDPDVAWAIHVTRRADGWLLRDVRGQDATLDLASVGAALPLAEVYHKITLDTAEDTDTSEAAAVEADAPAESAESTDGDAPSTPASPDA
jgi:Uma2 family endonuclease